jgi:hypothetical protein
VGKFLALFLIAYFGLYLYRRWKYKDFLKNNKFRKNIDYYENYDADEYEEGSIIDIEVDDSEDETETPKYLH